MTDPYAPPPAVRRRMLRELAGLVLLVAGFLALLVLLWSFDWRYAGVVLAGLATFVGWRLSTGADDSADPEGT